MSYDLEIGVKVDGLDKFVPITEPERAHPTYNIGLMLRLCMGWDYEQSEDDGNGGYRDKWYRCSDIIANVEQGIRELHTNRKAYEQYEPENGWGSIDTAIRALESLRNCIYKTIDDYELPIEHLWMKW